MATMIETCDGCGCSGAIDQQTRFCSECMEESRMLTLWDEGATIGEICADIGCKVLDVTAVLIARREMPQPPAGARRQPVGRRKPLNVAMGAQS